VAFDRGVGEAGGDRGAVPPEGKQIFLEGRLETRSWQDKDGQTKYKTEVICENFQMLGRAGERGGEPGGEYSRAGAGPSEENISQAGPDDDLPF